MKHTTWRALAFGALLGAVALPASAQVVIGGSGTPSVEVNWSVLDGLGRQPTLADMLKSDVPGAEIRPATQPKAAQGVQYRPYKAGAAPYAKAVKPAKAVKAAKPTEPKSKKSSVVPASVKSERMADLVQASRSPAPIEVKPAEAKPVEAKAVEAKAVEAKAVEAKATEFKPVEARVAEIKPVEVPRASAQPPVPPKPVVTPVTETPKPAAPAIIGPQIALPELPKPAAAPAAPPVQLVKAEAEPAPVPKVPAPKVEEPKVEAKSEPVAMPLPPTALTPPPLPAAKVEAPTQVASLAPAAAPVLTPVAAPTPAPAISSSRGGDTLTVPFATESARLPDASHGELDRLVKRMQKDDGLGLQLLAYADGDDANASKARRLSLSRALEVRKYLMDQGLRSTRIEVRALGNKIEGGGPADRVDAVLVTR